MKANRQPRPGRGPAGSPRRAPAGLLVALLAGLLPALLALPSVARESRQAAPPAPPEAPRAAAAAGRDSLLQEIRKYRQIIRVLGDSLARGRDGDQLSPEHRVVIEQNIGDITRVIEGIGTELRQLEFEVKDNRISLVDGAGDGIVINVPENLDERVSRGLEALSEAILKELPDSSGGGHRLSWSSFLPITEPPPPPRRIINGNLVRVGQSLVVAPDEDVRGNVVVVGGDCEVAGHVDGNVVAVGGALTLRDDAVVSGSVVSVGGRLATEPGAESGDALSLDLLGGGAGKGLGRLLGHRVLAFAVSQGLFFLTLLAALLGIAASPAGRLDAVLTAMRVAPARMFGTGALLVLVAPLLLSALTALLVITVIGVPVALLLVLAVAVVVVLGLSATGVIVGRRLGAGGRQAALAVLLGLCALHVPSFLAMLLNLLGAPLAAVGALLGLGFLVKAAALAWGLGALVLTRAGGRSFAA